MFRSLTSIAVGATAAASLLVAPAAATQVSPTPEANGLSSSSKGDKPEILDRHIKETLKFGKNEVCRFPVVMKADVHVRDVITKGGDNVYETAKGWVTVTNKWNHKHIHLRIKDRAWIKVNQEDDIRGYGYGKSLFWNSPKGEARIYSKHQGHVSAANRGHQANEGIYYVQGKYKFSITDVSTDHGDLKAYVKKGYVLDVCKALASKKHH